MGENTAKPLLLMITHLAPIPNASNAGQSFVTEQVRALQDRYHVVCLLLPGRSAREEVKRAIAPCYVLDADVSATRWSTLLSSLDRRIQHRFPGSPESTPSRLIRADPIAVDLLKCASVVVLQWQGVAGTGRWLRPLNRDARYVAVLHDVVSQSQTRFANEASTTRSRWRALLASRIASWSERSICRTFDSVIVLSDKDSDLLPPSDRIHVVPAPVKAPRKVTRTPVPGRAIIVSSWRSEDRKGLAWLLNDVVPRLGGDRSLLTLRLIGNYGGDHTVEEEHPGVKVVGFVDDLAEEYARASIALAPIWLGAGVKFKVVEALLHATPLVSTPVGAEGIGALVNSPSVASSASEFAQAIAHAIREPHEVQVEADALQAKASREFGAAAFGAAMLQAVPWD